MAINLSTSLFSNLKPVDLSNYNSSSGFVTLDDSLEDAEDNKLNFMKISHKINYEDTMTMYDENILYNYRSYLYDFRIGLEITEDYFYKPELVSQELYGTPDLWYLVMWMNEEIASPLEFNNRYIWVFDPSKINVLNKLIECNKEKLEDNHLEPDYVEDLTIKPVVLSSSRFL
jgi:hypothetical protein